MSNNECKALNIDVTLKGTSLGVINIPTKILKALKWNVNEIVQVCISDCVNHENEEWLRCSICMRWFHEQCFHQ